MPELTSIINKALGYLGAQSLTSLDEATPVAEKCRVFWPQTRDMTLRAHPWVCCQRRATLPRLAERPAFGFAAAFQLPEDFLRLVESWPPQGRVAVQGEVLLADTDRVGIVYVRREENANRYDPQLAHVLALGLARELAYALNGSASLAESLEKRWQASLAEARAANARERDPLAGARPSRWVAAKYGR